MASAGYAVDAGVVSPIVCTTPDLTWGVASGYNLPIETNLNLGLSHDGPGALPFPGPGALDVTTTCAEDWEGTVVVAPCAADGPYSLSGCNHIICTTPSAQALTGYNTPTETNLDLALGDFAVDISC